MHRVQNKAVEKPKEQTDTSVTPSIYRATTDRGVVAPHAQTPSCLGDA